MQHAIRKAVDPQPEAGSAVRAAGFAGPAPAPLSRSEPGSVAPGVLSDPSSRVTELASRVADIHSSPRAAAQHRRITSVFGAEGSGVVQRMLRTHETKSDEGKQIDETGHKGFINEYARWMAQDTAALVDGEPKGATGLLRTLKATPVEDAATIAGELRESVIESGAWRKLNDVDTGLLIKAVEDASGFGPNENETPDAYLNEANVPEDYRDELSGWIDERLSGLTTAKTVGAIDSGKIPFAWHSDMAYLVYEATRTTYYGADVQTYVPPFKQLIGKVDDDEVDSFAYVRKYGGSAKQNWGAEFTVDQPQELKEQFEGKAVLHTHYAAAGAMPNYAHTKPEDKKTQKGFGYTVVKTDKVTGVNETSTPWNALQP